MITFTNGKTQTTCTYLPSQTLGLLVVSHTEPEFGCAQYYTQKDAVTNPWLCQKALIQVGLWLPLHLEPGKRKQ